MLLFITKIKKEYDDNTIGISPLICSPSNFDFDGDAMAGISVKEMDMVPSLMKIHPSVNLLSGGKPGISGDIKPTKESILNINAYLNQEDANNKPLVIPLDLKGDIWHTQ